MRTRVNLVALHGTGLKVGLALGFNLGLGVLGLALFVDAGLVNYRFATSFSLSHDLRCTQFARDVKGAVGQVVVALK